MNHSALALILALSCLTACSKQETTAVSSSNAPSQGAPSHSPDAVQQKLQEYSGAAATHCGRLDVMAKADQQKTAADCAIPASQSRHSLYVAYDMAGLAVGVAGSAGGTAVPGG